MRAVREVLGLEGNSGPGEVAASGRADRQRLQVMAGVDLDPRLVTADRETQPGPGCRENGVLPQPGPTDDKGMVEPPGSGELGVRRPEYLTEHTRLTQVERRPLDGGKFPRGYAARPCW